MKKLILPALTILSISASTANAATYTIDYQQSNNPFSNNGQYSAVTIDSEIYDGTFYAGGFHLTNDALGQFIAFCIEVTQALKNGQEYAIVAKPFTDAVLGNVENLFNTSFDSVVDNVTSAAFQVAMWEIVEDTSIGLDLGSGTFSAVDAKTSGGSVLATAQGFLDGLNDTPTSMFDIDFLLSPDSQDVVTARRLDNPTPVPLPASGLLLLSAAGLIVVKRKKS